MLSRQTEGDAYRYGFNGKENDNDVKGEGNQISYQDRVYDSRLGRWTSTDPVTKAWLSPYQFSSNNPVNMLDPDGKDEIHFHFYTTYTKGPDGRMIGGPITSSFIVIKTNGPDRFFHHNHCTEIKLPTNQSRGGVSSYDKVIEFFPWYPKSRSGLTEHTLLGLNFPDRDMGTLLKYTNASSEAQEYIQNRSLDPSASTFDRSNYKYMLSIQPWNNAIEKVRQTAELTIAVVTLLDGGLALMQKPQQLWLGNKVALGADPATIKSFNNLTPKKGWFDVVIHGDGAYPGMLVTDGVNKMNAEQLFELMVKNGYQEGMKIRLISCNAGLGKTSSLAQELAEIANTTVIAPSARTLVAPGSKLVTEDNSKYLVFPIKK